MQELTQMLGRIGRGVIIIIKQSSASFSASLREAFYDDRRTSGGNVIK